VSSSRRTSGNRRRPRPSRVPGLPAGVDDILQRCLEKSPADRFPSVASLAKAIGMVQRTLAGSTEAASTSDLPGTVRCERTRWIADVADVTVPHAEPTMPHGLSGQLITRPESSGIPGRRNRAVLAGLVIGAAVLCSAGPLAVFHYHDADSAMLPSIARPLAASPGAGPPAPRPGTPPDMILPARASGPVAIAPAPTPEHPGVSTPDPGDAVSANTTSTLTPQLRPASDHGRTPQPRPVADHSTHVPSPPSPRRADRASTGEDHAMHSRSATPHEVAPLDVPLGD
jgi:hypothetical protein